MFSQTKWIILNIRVLSPQCGWSCGSSSVLIDQTTYHILSKCCSSLHYGQACAFSESQPHQMTCCIGHNCMLFLCCASSDLLLDWMTYGMNTCASCLHCTVGERTSLHFDFVLLRSGSFNNNVAFDKLEALYFKDFFNFSKPIWFKDFSDFYISYVFVESFIIILGPPIHGDLASPIDIYSLMDRIFFRFIR